MTVEPARCPDCDGARHPASRRCPMCGSFAAAVPAPGSTAEGGKPGEIVASFCDPYLAGTKGPPEGSGR